jgi:multisubunit Na+/H+ antiporter MnhB subunit
MESTTAIALAADAVLLLHALFVVFVVCGLVLILLGGALGWGWVRLRWFRIAHLCAIGVVVIQSWLGVICPLTTLEMALRTRAGESGYPGSFIAHWVEAALYFQAPPWVFVVCYTAFGLLVAAAWLWVRPRERGWKEAE